MEVGFAAVGVSAAQLVRTDFGELRDEFLDALEDVFLAEDHKVSDELSGWADTRSARTLLMIFSVGSERMSSV